MKTKPYLQVVEQLASARGFDPSKITMKQAKQSPALLMYDGDGEPELLGRYLKLPDQGGLLYLYLPSLESIGDNAPYASFPQSILESFRLNRIRLNYDIGKNPEFYQFLVDLRKTKVIPIEKLSSSYLPELIISRYDSGNYGEIYYGLGKPPLEKLCILVDRNLKEFVPEAEEQPDQGHMCIHGKEVRLIPVHPYNFSRIVLGLETTSIEGSLSLREILEGVPIPKVDLRFGVKNDNGVGIDIHINSLYDQFDVRITNPEEVENVGNTVTLIRRLEEMFKTK